MSKEKSPIFMGDYKFIFDLVGLYGLIHIAD